MLIVRGSLDGLPAGVDIAGNPLVKASHYGCGADGCTECYPYDYRCDCGFEYPAPIPNGMEFHRECLMIYRVVGSFYVRAANPREAEAIVSREINTVDLTVGDIDVHAGETTQWDMAVYDISSPSPTAATQPAWSVSTGTASTRGRARKEAAVTTLVRVLDLTTIRTRLTAVDLDLAEKLPKHLAHLAGRSMEPLEVIREVGLALADYFTDLTKGMPPSMAAVATFHADHLYLPVAQAIVANEGAPAIQAEYGVVLAFEEEEGHVGN
jgi:hypothetical protein